MRAPTATTYDEVPYESHPYPQSHPERLATIARLFGMAPPPIERCRVLELGCAAGGNLIPMAETLPESRFLGIELSSRQAGDGQAVINALGLKNIELRQGSITDIDEKEGVFDYIIAHGVFSWVPRQVQDSILKIAGKLLAPQGVAYISYNTYPGWHFYGLIRDLMTFHGRRFATPAQQIAEARSLLDFLDRWTPDKEDPYGQLLKRSVEQIRGKADWYLYHDHLENVNEPVYFHEFMARAQTEGLQFLGEADIGVMASDVFPAEVQKKLDELAPTVLYREQYMDFLRNRTFRQTLLCHNGVKLRRNLVPTLLTNFFAAANLRPVGDAGDLNNRTPVEYRRPEAAGVQMTTSDPLVKSALQVLAEAWPSALPLPEVWSAAWSRLNRPQPAQPLADAAARSDREAAEFGRLVYLGLTRRLIELHSCSSPFLRTPGDYPTASRLARHQAKTTNLVTNLRHEMVRLSEVDRRILPMLDGSRDRSALIDAVVDLAVRGILAVRENDQPLTDPARLRSAVAGLIDRTLPLLGQSALLVA